MDVYCPVCGEPWDLECLHEETSARRPDLNYDKRGLAGYCSREDYDRTYAAALAHVRSEFQSKGCKALERVYGKQNHCQPKPKTDRLDMAGAAAAMYDLLGDDMDGAAAMLEDFEAGCY